MNNNTDITELTLEPVQQQFTETLTSLEPVQKQLTKALATWNGRTMCHLMKESTGDLVFSLVSILSGFFNFLAATSLPNQQNCLKTTMGVPANISIDNIKKWFIGLNGKKRVATVTNMLRIAPGYQMNNSFRDTITGVGAKALQPAGNTNEQAAVINQEISRATKGMITDVVNPSHLENSIIMQVNAIAIEQDWKQPFVEFKKDQDFYIKPETKIPVTMMKKTETLPYHKGGNYTAIAMPCANKAVKMIFILPDIYGDSSMFEDDQFLSNLCKTLQEAKKTTVDISIPQSKVETSLDLKEVYKIELGEFFTNPDLQGALTTQPKNAEVRTWVHRAVMELGPTGFKAAAVTFNETGVRSCGGNTSFYVNKPFFMAVEDHGEITFFSRIASMTPPTLDTSLEPILFSDNPFFIIGHIHHESLPTIRDENDQVDLDAGQLTFKEQPNAGKFKKLEAEIENKNKSVYYYQKSTTGGATQFVQDLKSKDKTDLVRILNELDKNNTAFVDTYFKDKSFGIPNFTFDFSKLFKDWQDEMVPIPNWRSDLAEQIKILNTTSQLKTKELTENQVTFDDLDMDQLHGLAEMLFFDRLPLEITIAQLLEEKVILDAVLDKNSEHPKKSSHSKTPICIFLKNTIFTEKKIDILFRLTEHHDQTYLFLASPNPVSYPQEKLKENKAIFSTGTMMAYVHLFQSLNFKRWFNRTPVAADPEDSYRYRKNKKLLQEMQKQSFNQYIFYRKDRFVKIEEENKVENPTQKYEEVLDKIKTKANIQYKLPKVLSWNDDGKLEQMRFQKFIEKVNYQDVDDIQEKFDEQYKKLTNNFKKLLDKIVDLVAQTDKKAEERLNEIEDWFEDITFEKELVIFLEYDDIQYQLFNTKCFTILEEILALAKTIYIKPNQPTISLAINTMMSEALMDKFFLLK